MLSKYVTLLAFAASAIAGLIKPGIYRISNVASRTTVRSYVPQSPIYVSSSKEYAGPFELWDIRDSVDGSYTLKNVGLQTYATGTAAGEVILTGPKATSFNIEPAGNGEFVIKLPEYNLNWNAEPPVVPRGDIMLRPAFGLVTERWTLALASPDLAQDNYDERWDLLQRIGRFLGQYRD